MSRIRSALSDLPEAAASNPAETPVKWTYGASVSTGDLGLVDRFAERVAEHHLEHEQCEYGDHDELDEHPLVADHHRHLTPRQRAALRCPCPQRTFGPRGRYRHLSGHRAAFLAPKTPSTTAAAAKPMHHQTVGMSISRVALPSPSARIDVANCEIG